MWNVEQKGQALIETRDAQKIGQTEYIVTSYEWRGDFDPDKTRWIRRFNDRLTAELSPDPLDDRIVKMERLTWKGYVFTDGEYGKIRDAEAIYDDAFYREWDHRTEEWSD